jgi:hypothetical protein
MIVRILLWVGSRDLSYSTTQIYFILKVKEH